MSRMLFTWNAYFLIHVHTSTKDTYAHVLLLYTQAIATSTAWLEIPHNPSHVVYLSSHQ